MKAASYYRVSTKKQAERESIETQKAEMRPWATQKGYEVTEFLDDGISGEEISKRPAFSDLLTRLNQGEFHALLVFQVDRMGRFKERADRNHVMELIIRRKILVDTLYDGTFNPESEDHMDDLEKLLTEARRENRRRGKKVAAGLKRVKMQGRFAGGHPPYGVKWNGVERKWEIHEEEYRTLEEVFRLFRSGYGLKKIMRILNGDPTQYPSPRRRGFWELSSLHRIINRDVYFTGKLVYNKVSRGGRPKPKEEWVVIDTGLKLFTEEEMKEVRHQMSIRASWGKKAHHPDLAAGFLVQGLARCAECGGRLSIQTHQPRVGSRVYRYYRCRNSDRGICSFKTVNADELDGRVWEAFMRTLADPETLEDAIIREQFLPGTEAKDLEAQAKRAKQELERLAVKKWRINDLYFDGEISRGDRDRKTREIKRLEGEAVEAMRKAEQSLARPEHLKRAIRVATEEVLSAVRDIALQYQFQSEVREFAELPWEEQERIERQEPDHPWVKFCQKNDDHFFNRKPNDLSPEIEKLVFDQKRRIISRFVAGTGEVRVWSRNKLTIRGSIQVQLDGMRVVIPEDERITLLPSSK